MLSMIDRATKLLPGRHHTDEYARILLGLEDDRRVCFRAGKHVSCRRADDDGTPVGTRGTSKRDAA